MKNPFRVLSLWAVILVLTLVGWIKNIVWLFQDPEITAEFWIALVGVPFGPLGIVHGWMTFF
jgi:hypothetical protein